MQEELQREIEAAAYKNAKEFLEKEKAKQEAKQKAKRYSESWVDGFFLFVVGMILGRHLAPRIYVVKEKAETN